ncbi:hypothetical protein O9992_21835 [Vibrio lentus]|nr:hypothetical protein [Vibrio lentus]
MKLDACFSEEMNKALVVTRCVSTIGCRKLLPLSSRSVYKPRN